MNYPWYKEVHDSDSITQGDIIFECPIPSPDENLFQAILDEAEEIESSIDLQTADIIILTQACDIEHDKIDSVVLCPIWPLSTLIETNSYFKASKARESLRQGKEPAYHLLGEYTSDKIKLDFSIVDFHRIYSLPKKYIKQIAKNRTTRLRLLPPYREHLSQAFARYFMRVGLPIDIEKDAIKAYS
ncbi:hypothetical protein [Desulfobacter curvatus]|uniref:hypothetical protein n=1 Tax=Desulfobacter curvatus TaxID=2290 RepID=UPI00037B5664|nr:hypothetical protein [Desulfobacter curvatus]